MKKCGMLALFALILFSSFYVQAAGPTCNTSITITVSTSNDNSDCTCDADVPSVTNCNVAGALDVAQYNAGATTINLNGGTYSVSSPLSFSGEGGGTLNLQASEGATPVLDGSGLDGTTNGILSLTTMMANFTIQGITFQNGYTSSDGGALFIEADTGANFDVTLKNNTFINNKTPYDAMSPSGSGGAVYMDASSTTAGIVNVLLEGNVFQENKAAYGGGIFLNTIVSGIGGTVTIKGNTWTDNKAQYSNGALEIEGSVVTIGGTNSGDGNIVQNNEAIQVGNGGGSVFSTAGMTLIGNSVLGNHADQSYVGGLRLFNQGGALDVEYNLIDLNSSGRIGGLQIVHLASENVVINGNQFSNNTDALLGNGGGASISFTGVALTNPAVISNNLVYGNTADQKFGGMGIFAYVPVTLDIVNNTIVGNKTISTGATVMSPPVVINDGGGLGIAVGSDSVVVNLYNNIIHGNIAQIEGTGSDVVFEVGAYTPTLNIFNNDVDFTGVCKTTDSEDAASYSCGLTTVATTNGDNLDNVDPGFVDSASGNYHLLQTSPMIKVGSSSAPGLPAFDMTGVVAMDSPPDLGALQFVLSQLDINLTSHDFGNFTGGTQTQVFILTNNGSQSTDVTDISLTNDTDFSLNLNGTTTVANRAVRASSTTTACGSTNFSLASGASCSFAVSFNPQNFGSISGSLNVAYGTSSTITVPLSGFAGGMGGGGCSMNPVAETQSLSYLLWILPLSLGIALRRKSS